jgi:hypothetical protein
MFSADQLIAHGVGDYLLQSNWMAQNKTKDSYAAALHAVAYAAPFLLLKPSKRALSAIVGTHFLIDRFRLARYVCWAKNGASGPITATGYPESAPPWLATWLLIIADNMLHVLINGIALHRKAAD